MTLAGPVRRRRSAAALLLLCLLLALAWRAGAARAAEVVDDRGAAVRVAQPPRRIVSLLPSLTETVCALGACDRLVGVDDYSNYPPEVRSLPHVGGLEDASVERIVALRPDLVLLAQSARITGRLESLGLRVLALEPRSSADVDAVITRLGQVLDRDAQALALRREIDEGLRRAATSLGPAWQGARVYFEVNDAPYAAGEASFIGETLRRLGLVNIVPASLGPFPRLNPEYVVRADPQWILLGDRNAGALRRRPGWAAIDAIRHGRVCAFDPAEGDVLVRPGPRMAEAARLMVACLQGRRP